MNELPHDERRRLQVIAAALIAGPILFLGVGLLLRVMGVTLGHVPVVTYVAIGAALLSPVIAGGLRASILGERFAGEKADPGVARRALIVPFAILEGAAHLCALAFLLTPAYWPLLAALVPLGAMLLWFPRG